MPTYEFECEQCGERFTQKLTLEEKDKDVNCPYCYSFQVVQLFTSVTVLKPSGRFGGPGGGCFPASGCCG